MWPFRLFRRKAQPLGEAVTSIPSLVRPVPAPVAPAVVAPAVVAPAYVPPPLPPEPSPAPRVELGFRDGTTAALAPGSKQAQALTDIASLLTHRD